MTEHCGRHERTDCLLQLFDERSKLINTVIRHNLKNAIAELRNPNVAHSELFKFRVVGVDRDHKKIYTARLQPFPQSTSSEPLQDL